MKKYKTLDPAFDNIPDQVKKILGKRFLDVNLTLQDRSTLQKYDPFDLPDGVDLSQESNLTQLTDNLQNTIDKIDDDTSDSDSDPEELTTTDLSKPTTLDQHNTTTNTQHSIENTPEIENKLNSEVTVNNPVKTSEIEKTIDNTKPVGMELRKNRKPKIFKDFIEYKNYRKKYNPFQKRQK